MSLLLPLILLIVLLATATLTFAQDATSSPNRRDQLQQRLENRKEAVSEKRDSQAIKLDTRREMMASKAAILKQRLEQFKDQKKAQVVERVNSNLNAINQRRTEQMSKNLDKMTEILGKVEQRVDEAENTGQDITEAKAAVSSAKTAISSASAAVNEQSLKDYTIEATSEATIREDSRVKRDQLHKDLQAVRKLIIEAKQSVANAIRVTASTLGGIRNGQ